MSFFEHMRFAIYNSAQHPLKHTLDDFLYSNPAFGNEVVNLQQALDYITAVLYPQSQPAVANFAALPAAGNAINDMRVVLDDGDGKAASYRWEQREGEAVPSWHKIYDVDWGTDSVLEAWTLKTQDLYVGRYGYDDRDGAGNLIVGDLSGQSIFGGASANTNLTLFANAGDGVGPATGFVQVGDQFRPLTDNTIDVGTSTRRFRAAWFVGPVRVGTMTLASGSIADTSGALSFGSANLTTTGTVKSGTLTLSSGSITDTSAAISFGSAALTTTGALTANKVTATGLFSVFKSGTTVGTLTLADGSITDGSGALSFGSCSLTTTGTAQAATVTATTVNGGNLRLSANVLLATNVNGSVTLTPNGTGTIILSAAATGVSLGLTGAATALTVTGTTSVAGGNLQLAANSLTATNVGGNITLAPNGVGHVVFSSLLRPGADGTDVGDATRRVGTLYLVSAISDGTNSITVPNLLTFRSVGTPAVGDTLFWDGAKWVSSHPDSEIQHSELFGLTTGDAGHTQFALLAGRLGGQTLSGDTAASGNLVLDSTASATKGKVLFKSTPAPFTDAAFTTVWAGTDLGSSANRFNNIYAAGEHINLRVENVSALPTASVQKVGRLVYLTTDGNLYADSGTALLRVGSTNAFRSDTAWNGSETTKTVTVTTSGMDARRALWQLLDNTNNFDRIQGASIAATGASTVVVTVGIALPSGTYRLVGLE